MTHQERIQILFGEQQRRAISDNFHQIIEHLAKQKEKVTFYVHEVDITDIPKKIQNHTYLDDELLKFTETGISILDITPEITEALRPYIPRDVKELMLPSTFFSDITFLAEFPNVETLIISDYATFTKEQMDYIVNHTGIKNIEFRSINAINSLANNPGFCALKAGNTIAQYDRLTLFCRGYQSKWLSSIEASTNDYKKENLEKLDMLYEKIKDYLPPLTSATLVVGKDEKISATVSDGTVESIKATNTTPTEFRNVYDLVSKRTQVKKSIFESENTSYDDLNQLNSINETSDLYVSYQSINSSSHVTATFDEFANMRATIEYYKSVIEGNDLSPVEKVAYVYDILKTMRYQENEENKERARDIHAIVTDGYIVCQGYASFTKQLLSELGIKSISVSVTCPRENSEDEFHARNFVRIDDDKYNIHGLFALDTTWDSDKDVALIEEEGQKTIIQHPDATKDKILYQYDSLVLYRHFLTPMSSYESRYMDEIHPSLFEAYKAGEAKVLIDDAEKVSQGQLKVSDSKYSVALPQHMELFGTNMEESVVQSYLSAPKPSLETFKQILSTVRQTQGYTEEETKQEVDRVVDLHRMLAEQNPNSPDHFFKPATKK